jgi:hypothetical protein
MHDPLTQAFVLNIPLPWKRLKFGGLSPGKEWAKYHLATIWHKDPERGPGGDDSCGWILRAERPWYRHPRWHVHHWRIQVPLWQTFYRWAFERCSKCGGRFGWGESVIGDWAGTRIWHDNCHQDAATRISNQTPKTEG